MEPMVLRTSRGYWMRIGGLFVLFGLIALGIGVQAVRRGPPLMLAFAVALALTPAWLLWSRRRWVARLDSDGVQLRDGRRFAWANFEKVVAVYVQRGGARWLNHYELHFRDGRARLFHRMVDDAHDVLALLQALERGHNPFLLRSPG
jgi:hypothetical protein